MRALFEHQVMIGIRGDNPVPTPRWGQGLRPKIRILVGHLSQSRRRSAGRLVRDENRLPESIDPGEVPVFFSDLRTDRDRAICLSMELGGLRASEARSLRLADVDQGLHRLRVRARAARNGLSPSIACSLSIWLPICVSSACWIS